MRLRIVGGYQHNQRVNVDAPHDRLIVALRGADGEDHRYLVSAIACKGGPVYFLRHEDMDFAAALRELVD